MADKSLFEITATTLDIKSWGDYVVCAQEMSIFWVKFRGKNPTFLKEPWGESQLDTCGMKSCILRAASWLWHTSA